MEIASQLKVDHVAIKRLCVELEEEGKISLHPDENFYMFRLDTETLEQSLHEEPTACHVIFPTPHILTEFYYNSELVRMNIPIYRARQHQGKNSYDSAFFKEEVLAKYLSRPELYEIEDSLSGGSIKSLVTCDTFVYVRYGKRLMSTGVRAVVALYIDLVGMEEDEQRYWNGCEILDPEFTPLDENYEKFIDHTFEGARVEYHDPISNVLQSVAKVNDKIGGKVLFRNTSNPHLRPPVENTYKAFLDSCSELFKVIGPDSLNMDTLKSVIEHTFDALNTEFKHKSGRPLSAFQLLQLVEEMAGIENKASEIIAQVRKHRTRADHAVLKPEVGTANYAEQFNVLCDDVSHALIFFAIKIEAAIFGKTAGGVDAGQLKRN